VEQGPTERFAHRGFVRRQVAGASERYRGLVMVPGLEQCRTALKQVVDVFHSYESRTAASRAGSYGDRRATAAVAGPTARGCAR
jgi:hypothetical protein